MELNFGRVEGLPEEELGQLWELEKIYKDKRTGNRLKRRYYGGKISLNEVNLGIALPSGLGRLQIGCEWGKKTVDVLAARSMFDGFVSPNGQSIDIMNDIMRRNRLIPEYKKACREQLKYGCSFAAVYGTPGNARVEFYSPHCAAAAWNAAESRIDYGFAFADGRKDETDTEWSPEHVNFYTATDIWQLDKVGGHWEATPFPHKFGKPMMVAFVWDATKDKPFGQSRIDTSIRRMIQSYVRTVANATIGLEFATAPQKYLLGVTDEQYDQMIDNRFKQYVGSMFMASMNPETGNTPQFGQLQQGSIQPHLDMMRLLSTQFSAATGLTVTDTGIINDANPTSSDAILAQSLTLVSLAEELNTTNGESLQQIAQMALAVEMRTTPDKLDEEYADIMAHFKNPAMPSIAVTADAAIKIASVREGFADTDVFLEMLGFSQADIHRITAQERLAKGRQLLLKEFDADADTEEDVE